MRKKLMAVAVAGALAAPAVALAQASTVQIYGQITYEYGILDQGAGQHKTDYADNPGGSAIGFRGEEKLGGGLSAWFQCESSVDVRAIDVTGFCSRNSAVGFKGAFGNLHFGKWDTPMKRALSVGTVGAEETGILGMSFLPFGGSGGADATGTGDDATNRHRWKRREVALTYYESPVFNGFQVLAAFSPGIRAADIAASRPSTVANAKPRVISLAGTYSAGPLGIGVGYERHDEFGAYAPASITSDLDDRAWGITASYTFGPVKVGATYLDAKYETTPTTELKKKTWTLGVDWKVDGPHSIEAQYANAGDSKGNSLLGVNAASNGGVTASGPNTGGDAWSIAYKYAFSKRTSIKFGYVRVDNDASTSSYRIGNSGGLTTTGQNVDGYAFHIRHRF